MFDIGYALSLATGLVILEIQPHFRENSTTASPSKWRFLTSLTIIVYLLINSFWPQDNGKLCFLLCEREM